MRELSNSLNGITPINKTPNPPTHSYEMSPFYNKTNHTEMKKVTFEIRDRITVPSIYWYQHAQGGRGIYYMDGRVHYLHIDTPQEQAESLKMTNKIHSYHTDKRGNVTMYKMSYINNSFIEKECYWQEFTFSPDDIKDLAANQEFKKACASIGITGQVINLYNKIKQRAA